VGLPAVGAVTTGRLELLDRRVVVPQALVEEPQAQVDVGALGRGPHDLVEVLGGVVEPLEPHQREPRDDARARIPRVILEDPPGRGQGLVEPHLAAVVKQGPGDGVLGVLEAGRGVVGELRDGLLEAARVPFEFVVRKHRGDGGRASIVSRPVIGA
jgi:hypothetical protein